MDTSTSPSSLDRRLGLVTAALLCLWSSVVVYTVHPVLPANPLRLPLQAHNVFPRLLPQGWGFFTRDARAPQSSAFLRTPAGVWVPATRPDSWPHILTFSRRSKLPGVEIGLLLSAVVEPHWQPCRGGAQACLDGATDSGAVASALPSPRLCGDVGIIARPPVPWAWSRSAPGTVMPGDVLRLRVTCHD